MSTQNQNPPSRSNNSATVHELDFHGDRLQVVDDGGGVVRVVLRPVLEGLGVDYQAQLRRLRRKSWGAKGVAMMTIPTPGGPQTVVTVDIKTLLMLLATIDEARVAEHAQPKLVAYQAEVADVVEAYFIKGGAVNRRATPEQLDELERKVTLLKRETLLRSLPHLVPLMGETYCKTQAEHVVAELSGREVAAVAPRLLTVSDYLAERGVTGAALRSLAGAFGARLKTAYRGAYGGEPPKVDRFVDGAVRQVAAYDERHRPLFDATWTAYAANQSTRVA